MIAARATCGELIMHELGKCDAGFRIGNRWLRPGAHDLKHVDIKAAGVVTPPILTVVEEICRQHVRMVPAAGPVAAVTLVGVEQASAVPH